MIILTHTLAGAAIGAKVNNAPVAFLLGMVSHFILDAIPHFDQGTIINPFGDKDVKWPKWVYWTLVLDVIVTLFIFFLLKNRPDFHILIWGAVGGISVDVLENFPWKTLKTLPIFKQIGWLHHKVHFNLPTNKWYIGLIFEVIVTGGLLWYLLRF